MSTGPQCSHSEKVETGYFYPGLVNQYGHTQPNNGNIVFYSNHNDGWDPPGVSSFCARAATNLVPTKFGDLWGYGNRDGSAPICMVDHPFDEKKYECCTKPAGETTFHDCGPDWCPSTNQCKSYLKDEYCRGDNLLNDPVCLPYWGDNASYLNTICSDQSKFRSANCQTFCTSQVYSTGSYASSCLSSAEKYCSDPKNKDAEECKCINYKNTNDYAKYIKAFPEIAQQASYQCWSKPCSESSQWSDIMTSNDKKCPSTLQICAQDINIDSIEAKSVGDIQSTCNQKSGSDSNTDTKTDTNIKNDTNTSPTKAPADTVPPAATKPPSKSYGLIFCIVFTIIYFVFGAIGVAVMFM